MEEYISTALAHPPAFIRADTTIRATENLLRVLTRADDDEHQLPMLANMDIAQIEDVNTTCNEVTHHTTYIILCIPLLPTYSHSVDPALKPTSSR